MIIFIIHSLSIDPTYDGGAVIIEKPQQAQ